MAIARAAGAAGRAGPASGGPHDRGPRSDGPHDRTLRSDILSDVLRAVRMRGAVFFRVTAAAPWAAGAPAAVRLVPLVMPDAQNLIEYHVVVSGSCWAAIPGSGEAPVKLEPGSVLVVPQGDAHVMASEPDAWAAPAFDAFMPPSAEAVLPFHLTPGAGGPPATELICGFLGYDSRPFNPLVQALPRLLHIPRGYGAAGSWLGSLIDATVLESRERRFASAGVLARLSELIFIEAVRRHAEQLPQEALGWLSALRDPQVGRVLQQLHQDPRRHWTLAELGREVGLSRSVLAERFAAHIGMPPIAYLTNWRMQLAAGLLTGSAKTLAQIAEEVGYESEATLSRGFRRATGCSPGEWRRGGGGPPAERGAAGNQPTG